MPQVLVRPISFVSGLLRSPALLGCLAWAALSGCSADTDPPRNECPGPQATFDVRIFAADGPLPGDTTVDVMFSSGEEVYQLDQPEVPLEAVRCSRELNGESAVALDCALWTNGPATVTITATGYPELKEELVHEHDDCGIKTVNADLELMLPPIE
ncbi:MAG: hypothetical protein KC492_29440 [Myxococcales bacterium]|nr:hypothetical protein [Myxococcales bacterium]